MPDETTPDAAPSAAGQEAGQEYVYKPSLMGAAWELSLEPDALAWRTGGHQGRIPYGRITRVRLSFRPVTMQTRRFVTEILVGRRSAARDRLQLLAVAGGAGGAGSSLRRLRARAAPAPGRRRHHRGVRDRLARRALLAGARDVRRRRSGACGAHRAGAADRAPMPAPPSWAACWRSSCGRAARISGATGRAATIPTQLPKELVPDG